MTPPTKPCKYCEMPIFWAKGAQGGSMPVSANSLAKRIVIEDRGTPERQELVGHVRDTYLNHFADCPRAEDVKAGRRP